MSKERIAIVGGGGAGDSAAFGLREAGFEGEVVLISADADRPYDRPYLSKELIRGEVEPGATYLHEPDAYEKAGIELTVGERVVGGSLSERRLELAGGGAVAFDRLVLATGSTPRALPGVPRAGNLYTLRSLQDSVAIRDELRSSAKLLLIGAGFIGAEVAASARALGKEVLIVESAPVPLARALGEEVGAIYAAIHRDHGVDLRTGTTITGWQQDEGRLKAVTLSDGRQEEFDMVLVGIGVDANLDLAESLGIKTEGGGIPVDGGLRSPEGVYCAGDIAAHEHPLFGRRIRAEHWEVAKGQGGAVAAAIAGGAQVYSALPYFWSDQYDVSLEYRGQASGSHQLVWRGDREARSFSVFYLRDGLVDAVLSMNDSATNEAGGALIERRARVDPQWLAGTDDLGNEPPPN